MAATDYGKLLGFMLQELRQGTPATVVKIEALQAVYGTTLVFYGAYVALGLQLHVDRYGVEGLTSLTRQDVFRDIPAEVLTVKTQKLIEEVVQCFCAELHVNCPAILARD
jgi:hypothetical protein